MILDPTAHVCPHCHHTMRAHPNATVTHRCPQNRNRTTRYQHQEDTAE